jgi:hypothetical protein
MGPFWTCADGVAPHAVIELRCTTTYSPSLIRTFKLDDFHKIMTAVLAVTNAWGSLQTGTTGRVGFDSMLDQMAHKAQKRGFEFNIMVVGESGLGK